MARKIGHALALASVVMLLVHGISLDLGAMQPSPTRPAAVQQDYGKPPLVFVPQSGQTESEIHFVAHTSRGILIFMPGGVALRSSVAAEVKVVFEQANPLPEIVGVDRLPGVVNYYLGNDANHWRVGLPTYSGVTYRGLYAGIDLRYGDANRSLKGTYLIAPGADPSSIRYHYEGATEVRLGEGNGSLIVSLPSNASQPLERQERKTDEAAHDLAADAAGTVVEEAPVAWQMASGRRVPVEVRYALYGGSPSPAIGFSLGAYDHTLPLIIDPTLVYSTYLGGSSGDAANSIAVDGAGNVYITGETGSTDFAGVRSSIAPGAVFVSKLNAAGTVVVYVTYLGGDSIDVAKGIAVDGAGNAYVAGNTQSADFPTTANAPQLAKAGGADMFITKLGASGQLIYSTFLGGAGEDSANGIAVDNAGAAYVTGYADYYVAVAKLRADGSAFAYAETLGPNATGSGNAIAVDLEGNAYVTGNTSSSSFPTVNPLQSGCAKTIETLCDDVFVLKLNAAGDTLLFSTYLGGDYVDYGNAIALDKEGNIYVAGETQSADFPTTANAIQRNYAGRADAFVAKIKPDGSALLYSTYLGGPFPDAAYSIAVDSAGNAVVVGRTAPGFPLVDAIQSTHGGGTCGSPFKTDPCPDIFVSKISGSGNALLFSTFLGGGDDDEAYGVAVDSSGAAYVTGVTYSSDFPTTQALQPAKSSEWRDTFVTKISFSALPPPEVSVLQSGDELNIRWTAGNLESAPSVAGPWSVVPGAVASPYKTRFTEQQRFYRARQ